MGEGGNGTVYELVSKRVAKHERVAKKTVRKMRGRKPVAELGILREEGLLHKEVQRIAKNRQRDDLFLELISMWFLDRFAFIIFSHS